MKTPTPERSGSWKWWICGLLLLASTINYMDRQTLANASVRITTQFGLTQAQYGRVEGVFGWAFAAGSLSFGLAVDRVSVRWLYPLVVALWSGVGFATGQVGSYSGLLLCRTLLGFFEGGHWPCAIKTTQRLLDPAHRGLGNSVLQSGTSIGAIATPILLRLMLTEHLESWRLPFQVVGAAGLLWVVAWFALVRSHDLSVHPETPNRSEMATTEGTRSGDWKQLFLSRRMLVLFFVIACINTTWQILRAWLPKFMQQMRGYSEADTLTFNAFFYVATDVGCLGAGALALWLARRGRSVDRARSLVFMGCAIMTLLTIPVACLPRGGLLLALLLVAGAGALGVFPLFHAFTQEISAQRQGRVTGITGVAAWLFSSWAQVGFGWWADRTGSFDTGMALIGLLPLLAAVALWCGWENRPPVVSTPRPVILPTHEKS